MGISSRERAVQRQGPEIQCCISPLQQVEQEMRMEVALAATFGQAPFGTWHVKCGPWRRPHSGHTRRGRSRLSGEKKRKTPNALYLTDRKGLPLAMSAPKSGEHHDTHNIVAVMQDMMADMAKANIRTDGLFLNADAGFDCVPLRSVLKTYGIVANICINKRNGTGNDSIVLDELLYRERYYIERTNVWIDSYRTILNRFDTTLRNWESWNYIAFSVMLLRKCVRKRKV